LQSLFTKSHHAPDVPIFPNMIPGQVRTTKITKQMSEHNMTVDYLIFFVFFLRPEAHTSYLISSWKSPQDEKPERLIVVAKTFFSKEFLLRYPLEEYHFVA